MGINSFSVTLNGSASLYSDGSTKADVYALSVRRNSESGRVVTTFTQSCAYTGAIRQSISFVGSGLGGLPMPAKLRRVIPGELADMYQSILPKLVEFMQVMASALPKERN